MDALDQRIVVMEELALKAGECLRSFFGKDLMVNLKGEIDLVTEADREAERLIISGILSSFPQDGILAEESGGKQGENPWLWIVDPLDGTTNFASGLPHFSVSIGVKRHEEMVGGVVSDPMKNEFFMAVKGKGAFLNGKQIKVRQERVLENALTATGFPYNRRQRMEILLARVNKILLETRGLRRLGSAALDLAYVASGRLDLFIEDGLNAWDIAAGILLVKEAGGEVIDFLGSANSLANGQVIAGNGRLAQSAMSLV